MNFQTCFEIQVFSKNLIQQKNVPKLLHSLSCIKIRYSYHRRASQSWTETFQSCFSKKQDQMNLDL